MRYVLALSALLFISPSLSANAQGILCGTRTDIAAGLQTKFSETPVSIGLATNGSVIEVFASANGSFTVMMTAPNGRSCLIAAGQNWENLKARLTGMPT